jgi:hypothetical protein
MTTPNDEFRSVSPSGHRAQYGNHEPAGDELRFPIVGDEPAEFREAAPLAIPLAVRGDRVVLLLIQPRA